MFYYYAEVLGNGKKKLDRVPRNRRIGWWGSHDTNHNDSDRVSGWRQVDKTIIDPSDENIEISNDEDSRLVTVSFSELTADVNVEITTH